MSYTIENIRKQRQQEKEVAWKDSSSYFQGTTKEINAVAVDLFHAFVMTRSRLKAETDASDALSRHNREYTERALNHLKDSIIALRKANEEMEMSVKDWNAKKTTDKTTSA